VSSKIDGQKKFSQENAISFAKATGDFNPIHVDINTASQTVFGTCIVHGMNLVLWSLDKWFSKFQKEILIKQIEVSFKRAVLIGEKVELIIKEPGIQDWQEITILVKEHIVVSIRIEFSNEPKKVPQNQDFLTDIIIPKHPLDPQDIEIDYMQENLRMRVLSEEFLETFPFLYKYQSKFFIQSLGQLSVLIGMHCPGLRSLFSEFKINFFQSRIASNKLSYKVTKFDRRFSLIKMSVTSGMFKGQVSSFLRAKKVQQLKISELMLKLPLLIEKKPFSGQKALIIGGSRGLGQLTSKILALGGAKPFITYLKDVNGAQATAEELKNAGLEAEIFQYDVCYGLKAAKELASKIQPQNLYYFATPAIFLGQKSVFSKELFDRFSSIYIIGLAHLLNSMIPLGLCSVYAPSTVALEENMTNMTEYCAAKAAMEQLLKSINFSYKNLRVDYPRLPRLSTDQTTSFLPVHNQDPLPYIYRSIIQSQGIKDDLINLGIK